MSAAIFHTVEGATAKRTGGFSVLICTHNRAAQLRDTLAAVDAASWPVGVPAELLVVDNGSTDETASVIRGAKLKHLAVRYLSETRGKKAAGLNQAVRSAAGEILIFVDDDIRPETNWVEELTGPISRDEADAVQGSIRMAEHLRRPWMKPEHYLMFACNEGIGVAKGDADLVGANMAIRRAVFARVLQFDEAIGPGICPGGEDTLLSWQLKRAGFRVVRVANAVVEHHFDSSRLTRKSMLDNAKASAIGDFHLLYHWRHWEPRYPLYLLIRTWMKLQYYRLKWFKEWSTHPAAPTWEKSLVQEIAMYRQFVANGHPPRQYEQFGLKKKCG